MEPRVERALGYSVDAARPLHPALTGAEEPSDIASGFRFRRPSGSAKLRSGNGPKEFRGRRLCSLDAAPCLHSDAPSGRFASIPAFHSTPIFHGLQVETPSKLTRLNSVQLICSPILGKLLAPVIRERVSPFNRSCLIEQVLVFHEHDRLSCHPRHAIDPWPRRDSRGSADPCTPSSIGWSGWLQRCTLAAIGLGLALRCYHYGRNPSVWHDEAALILNVLGKSFVGLLGPLYFAEAGPPLFLWLERAVRLLLGDGVFPLRFLPFAASCLALAMVAATARHLLRPAAAPIAVMLFACSRSLLWHASEAKPYALDIALAVLLPMLVCGPMRKWSLERRLIGFGLLAPLVIMLSYPGCFLMGGVGLSLLPEVWRSRRRSAWLAFLFFYASVSLAFLFLFFGPIQASSLCEHGRLLGQSSCTMGPAVATASLDPGEHSWTASLLP